MWSPLTDIGDATPGVKSTNHNCQSSHMTEQQSSSGSSTPFRSKSQRDKANKTRDLDNCSTANQASEQVTLDSNTAEMSNLTQSGSVSNHPVDKFSIIDVTADVELFRTFVGEWRKSRRYSLSLACRSVESPSHDSQNSLGFHEPDGDSQPTVSTLTS
mgnify:FL=1